MLKAPVTRLSLIIVLLTLNLLFVAKLFGFIPNPSEAALEFRKNLCESLAIQFSVAAQKKEFQTIQQTLRLMVQRYDNIRSAAIRTNDGKLYAMAGEHLSHWKPPIDGKSTFTHVHVPVLRNNKKWATVEIRFAPIFFGSLSDEFVNSFLKLIAFVALGGFICYFLVFKRTLRELDPSNVIPDRVQNAFDVLQEGVLILDEKEYIVMANSSFAGLFDKSPTELIGTKGSELGWLDYSGGREKSHLPWFKAMQNGKENNGGSLRLRDNQGRKIKLSVNAALVADKDGNCRGTLVTFDDISELEEKNFELNHMVEKLEMANEEIQAKSQELETMANFDPLTQTLNRRSLAKRYDSLFNESKSSGFDLSCIMVDIDFFKSVNDRFGHSTGDHVIKAVAGILNTHTRDSDLVGRYGGEEFCIILPQLYLDKAVQIAERIRQTIEKGPCSGVNITVSLGVSSLQSTTKKPSELIDQADKALYAAKKSGRNRVITWDKDSMATIDANDKLAVKEHSHKAQRSQAPPMDATQMQRRVQELEGLVEKRGIELSHYEMYDIKTGLPTRHLFENRIQNAIARCQRGDFLVAVLTITIEMITRVNESYGAEVAEQLVNACGGRLSDILRQNIDTVSLNENDIGIATVSLITQAEFGVLISDIKQVDHVTWVMKRMLDAFEKPFKINDHEIYTSPCFGVSLFPNDGQTVDQLCRSATNACRYVQKEGGNVRYMFSSKSLNELAVYKLKIENSLHEAIQNGELELHYQPIIDSTTKRVAGFEALLRWHSESLGYVPPEEFITVAEQSGQIEKIGYWVIYRTCEQLRSWIDLGLELEPVSVNISGIQLLQTDFADRVQEIIEEFEIDSQLLVFELTESTLVDNQGTPLKTINRINKMGINVTMDDFGTGYSSLSYLKNIPLSGIKIDRSFISGIKKNKNTERLIKSIVSMAHGLGLEVVAEGVEEKYQADHLIDLGCEYLQGYYFGRPIPKNDVAEILKRQSMPIAV